MSAEPAAFHEPKDAKMFKEYAQPALDRKGSRTVNGHAIKLDDATADKMIAYWREKVATETSG